MIKTNFIGTCKLFSPLIIIFLINGCSNTISQEEAELKAKEFLLAIGEDEEMICGKDILNKSFIRKPINLMTMISS